MPVTKLHKYFGILFNVTFSFVAGQVPPSPQPDARLRWRKDQTQWRQERERDGERVKAFSEPDFLVLGNLASEVSMVTLDMLEIIIRVCLSAKSPQGVIDNSLVCLAYQIMLSKSRADILILRNSGLESYLL